MWNSPLYGNYRNRKFNQIWEDVESFTEDYNEFNSGIISNGFSNDKSVPTLFYLLSSYYGNSTVASENEYQFKMKLFSIVFMYGPTWEKRLEIQKKVREMDIEELRKGGRAVYNTALNPAQPVSGSKGQPTGEGMNSLDELTYINQQNTTNYSKSLPEAYAILANMLETDVTKDFIDKFKKLFLKVVTPEVPLWYISDNEGIVGGGSDSSFDRPGASEVEIDQLKKRQAIYEELFRVVPYTYDQYYAWYTTEGNPPKSDSAVDKLSNAAQCGIDYGKEVLNWIYKVKPYYAPVCSEFTPTVPSVTTAMPLMKEIKDLEAKINVNSTDN